MCGIVPADRPSCSRLIVGGLSASNLYSSHPPLHCNVTAARLQPHHRLFSACTALYIALSVNIMVSNSKCCGGDLEDWTTAIACFSWPPWSYQGWGLQRAVNTGKSWDMHNVVHCQCTNWRGIFILQPSLYDCMSLVEYIPSHIVLYTYILLTVVKASNRRFKFRREKNTQLYKEVEHLSSEH